MQDHCKVWISQLKKQITFLTSLQESSFLDIREAKVDEVRKQLHKEAMELKKLQKEAVHQCELGKNEEMVSKSFVTKTLKQQKHSSCSIRLKLKDHILN